MRVICFCLLLTVAMTARADVLQVQPNVARLDLASDLALLEDASGALSIDDVRARSRDFEPWTGTVAPNLGFTASAWWAYLRIDNPTGDALSRVFAIELATVDSVRLYLERTDGTRLKDARCGLLEEKSGALLRRTCAFKLDLPPGESVMFVRFESQNELPLQLALWEPDELVASDLRLGMILALVYGVLLLVGLYNLALGFYLGAAYRAFYALYSVSLTFWLAAVDGTAHVWWPGLVAEFPRAVFGLPGILVWCAHTPFALGFLRQWGTRSGRALFLVIGWAATVGMLAGNGVLSWRLMNQMSVFNILIATCIALAMAIRVWRAGGREGMWMSLAITAKFVLAAMGALTLFGTIPALGPAVWLHAGFTAEALILAFGLADSAARDQRNLGRLHAAGARFVPMAFLRLLGRKELTDVELGDQVEREMTVYFSDIRSFTTLVEGMSPKGTIAFVNAYLAAMEPPIREHGGVVDKYIGDAVMALFESADDGLAASHACLAALDQLNATRSERGLAPIRIGIGLHTGPLVLGTVGSEGRLNATVLGDTVNTASRVEGQCKSLGRSLLLTSSVKDALSKGAASLESVGEIALRGRSQPTELFSPKGTRKA